MRALNRFLLAAAVALLALLPRTGLAHSKSALSIDNRRGDTLTVQIDDRVVGAVPGRDQRTFAAPRGTHEVEVRAGRDLIARRLVRFESGRVETLRFVAPTGTVLLENDSGTRLSIAVDGRRALDLHDGERRSLTLDVGRHTVSATYVQLGQVRTLRTESLRLAEGERERVRLEPVGVGLVEVRNRTGRDAELFIDGGRSGERSFGLLRSGESRVLELALGSARFRLVDSRRGFLLDEQRLTVRAYADQYVVADEPAVGLASVRNDGGATLRLYVDGGFRETLLPYEREQVELSVGFHRLELRDHRGRVIQRATVTVGPYDVARVDFEGCCDDRDHDHGHRDDDRDVASYHSRPTGHGASARP